MPLSTPRSRDAIVPVDSMQTALRHLRQAQAAIQPGAGHLPYVEQPEGFNRLLLDFTARFPPQK